MENFFGKRGALTSAPPRHKTNQLVKQVPVSSFLFFWGARFKVISFISARLPVTPHLLATTCTSHEVRVFFRNCLDGWIAIHEIIVCSRDKTVAAIVRIHHTGLKEFDV